MKSLLLFGVIALVACGSRHQASSPVPVSPYIGWLEANGVGKPRQVQNRLYPLALLQGWRDISFDPSGEKQSWATAAATHFPLRLGTELQVFRMGEPQGVVKISTIGPQEVGTNSLVTADTTWASAHPIHLDIGEGLTALWGGPKQRPWTSHLDKKEISLLSTKLRSSAKAALNLENDAKLDSEKWSWCYTPRGEMGLGYARFQVGQHQLSWTALVLANDEKGFEPLWSLTGKDEGEFGAPIYEFLDAEDLDGDGIPEVIAYYLGFEGTHYTIFQFDGKKGGPIYEGSFCGL